MDDWLTIAQAAARLGVSAGTLRRWDRSGKLVATRHPISGYRLYRPSQLDVGTPVSHPPPPLDDTPLVGRESELRALLTALDEASLVVLTGPPGIGKSRLAREALTLPGAIWADCADALDRTGFLVGVGAAVAPGTAVDEADIARRLGARPVVLVLDNLEQLVDEGIPELIRAWLDGAPSLRVLGTSREALRVRGERRLSLQGLHVEAACAVFRRVAGPDWPGGSVRELAARLEGNPLAVELAASQADVFAPEALLEQLSVDLLRSDRRDVMVRHRSMGAAVSGSLARLRPELIEALSRLLLFRGGFEVGAARATLGPDGPSQLRELLRRSLLRTWMGDDGRRRFAPWVVVRQVCEHRFPAPADAAERHAQWMLTVVREGVEGRRRQAEWLNFRAAVLGPNVPATLRAHLLMIDSEWTRRFDHVERDQALSNAIEHIAPGSLRARMLARRAGTRMERSMLTEAQHDLAQAASDLGAQPTDPLAAVQVHTMWAMLHLREGEAKRALDNIGHAETALANTGHHSPKTVATERALVRYVRACVGQALGRTTEAIDDLHRTAHEARAVGNSELALSALTQATRLAATSQHPVLVDAPLRLVAEATATADQRLEAYNQETVGIVLQQLGRLQEADAAFARSVQIAKRSGHREQEGSGWIQRASVALEWGRAHQALGHATEAMDVLQASTGIGERARAFALLAAAWLGSPDPSATRWAPQVSGGAIAFVAVARALEAGEADLQTLIALLQPHEAFDGVARAVARALRARAKSQDHRVDPEGAWLATRGGERVILHGRPTLQRIVGALHGASCEGRAIGTTELMEVGWPDQRLVGDSGTHRVRSAIWTLRDLGLRDVLHTTPVGYWLTV